MKKVIHIDEPAHIWFGLSYASFYVMPRVVLQSAPPELQRRFIEAAEAIHDAVGRYGKWGSLACYNAGEGRYKQLMKYGRRLPQETIDYQRKVLG